MGLVSNKDKLCPVCGKATPKLLAKKVQGEPICSDCAGNILADSDIIKGWSMDDLKKHMQHRAENQRLVENFAVTRTIDYGHNMMIDDNNQIFYIKQWTVNNPPIIRFDAILGFDLKIGWNTVESWSRGMQRTPYQPPQMGMLGSLAALADAFDDDDDKRSDSKSETIKVTLHLQDPYLKDYELLDASVYGRDALAFERDFAEEMARVNMACNLVAAMAGGAGGQVCAPRSSTAQASAAPSADRTADDIVKFKGLLDAGVITQAEFDAKKKQLLGI